MERFREEEGLRHKEELQALSEEIQLLKEKEKEWRSSVDEVRREVMRDQNTQISSLTVDDDGEEMDGQRRRRRDRETDNEEEGGEVSRRRSDPVFIDGTVE